MREWTYKTDEKGRPRRFLSHRELVLWAGIKVGTFVGPPLAFGAVFSMVSSFFGSIDFELGIFLWVAALGLIASIVVVALIYAYVALSGGVMGSDERRSYLEEVRESRRGRW